ncbi:MAG: efflux RND transporter permease subunit, partial [Deltaproteobacteria bacterium]|nr:efflux RND transporter permease subunit [Deltaproteobacteria bacterium]
MIKKIIIFTSENKFFVFALLSVALVWSFFTIKKIPLDAIPDLSETQVIIFTEWMGRSPDLIEDQITYPITSKMLSAPHARDVRGYSMFGMSFVYVLFEEGTDEYWARSRVLEYLSAIKGKLPQDANPVLGPDATSLGWVFQYAIVDRSGKHDLSDLRTLQEFNLRYALESVEGVAEVVSIGGFMKQYNIEVKPDALYARGITIGEVAQAVRKSNLDVGGRVMEMSEREYFVRGKGYVKNLKDVEEITVRTSKDGIPVKIKDIATVSFGPDIRRGAAELDGEGEAVGGVVI